MSSPIRKITDYALTARHLKPSQVYHRLRLAMRGKLLHRSSLYRSLCDRQGSGQEPFHRLDFHDTHAKSFDIEAMQRGTFQFLNRSVTLGIPTDWFPPSESRLWIFHLHSFDYAVTLAQRAAAGDSIALDTLKRLVDEWIPACPAATKSVWHSYPLSLRIANWIKAYSLVADTIESDDAEFARRMRRSIYSQTCFLTKHLEYDLLNNHLLENGRALLLAGHFFDDRRSSDWRKRGRRILQYGLDEHILADGGHNELSPMYHQIVLELYQESSAVMRQRGETPPPEMDEKIAAMQSWLRSVLHPDGQIPLLNDAALKIAPDPKVLLDGTATACDDEISLLTDSGLFCFRDNDRGNFLVFDTGPIGPDHQPGHGHCDALSFELSLGGQRMIVDSGVEQYHEDPQWRHYYRSTRAHNTVVVDQTEQSEIWGSFRVARRARPLSTHVSCDDDQLCYVAGGHSGYLRLPGEVRHQRMVSWVDRRFWVVTDLMQGRGTHQIESFLHFHPDVDVAACPLLAADSRVSTDSRPGLVARGDATLQVLPWISSSAGDSDVGKPTLTSYHGCEEPIQGWYAPEFGRRIARTSWRIATTAPLPLWTGYVLWPEATDVSVRLEDQRPSQRDDECRIVVTATDIQYSLSFRAAEVKLEKQPVRPQVATAEE